MSIKKTTLMGFAAAGALFCAVESNAQWDEKDIQFAMNWKMPEGSFPKIYDTSGGEFSEKMFNRDAIGFKPGAVLDGITSQETGANGHSKILSMKMLRYAEDNSPKDIELYVLNIRSWKLLDPSAEEIEGRQKHDSWAKTFEDAMSFKPGKKYSNMPHIVDGYAFELPDAILGAHIVSSKLSGESFGEDDAENLAKLIASADGGNDEERNELSALLGGLKGDLYEGKNPWAVASENDEDALAPKKEKKVEAGEKDEILLDE